jgi:transmembrane sensor
MEPAMKPDRPAIARVARETADHLDDVIASSDARSRARQAFLGKVAQNVRDDLEEGWLTRLFAATRLGNPWRVAILASLAIAVGMVFLFRPLRPSSLTFTIAGSPGNVGDWVGARGAAPRVLSFSDGSELTLRQGADLRVTATDARGARVLLERGNLHAAIVHTGKSVWSLGVGPYDVRVTGTRFDVGWAPDTQQLSLDLLEGSVVVGGCSLGERKVHAGESLHTTCGSVPEVAPHPAPSPTPTLTLAPAPAPTLAPPASAPSVPLTWNDLAAAGRYKEALSLVQPDYDGRCASASPTDLLALADVARYAGDAPRANQAWLALRERFAADPRVASAAFFLGRAAFEGARFTEAESWFQASVEEAPLGPFAREAAGRLIEACGRAGDHDAARQAARVYLHEYPTGPHAKLAESVTAN